MRRRGQSRILSPCLPTAPAINTCGPVIPSIPTHGRSFHRLVGVPLPDGAHGAFEDLHGEAGVVGFSRCIRRLVAKHFGHPSRGFLRRLAEWRARDEPGLLAWLEQRRSFYLRQAHRLAAPGRRLDRVHEKMATVYAAGCLAIEFLTGGSSRSSAARPRPGA